MLSLMLCSAALTVLERRTTVAILSTLQHPSCRPTHHIHPTPLHDRLFVLLQGTAPEKNSLWKQPQKGSFGFWLVHDFDFPS